MCCLHWHSYCLCLWIASALSLCYWSHKLSCLPLLNRYQQESLCGVAFLWYFHTNNLEQSLIHIQIQHHWRKQNRNMTSSFVSREHIIFRFHNEEYLMPNTCFWLLAYLGDCLHIFENLAKLVKLLFLKGCIRNSLYSSFRSNIQNDLYFVAVSFFFLKLFLMLGCSRNSNFAISHPHVW